jgi:TRAP-type C4-dicarboxylate transport system permease small subunit
MSLKASIRFLVTWLDRAAVLALLGMMLTTVCDIAMRSALNKPITGATEIVELWLGASFFLAAPGVFARGANIAVDMIDQWLPSWSVALRRLSALLAMITLGMFTWHMWQPMLDVVSFGDTSADLQIPKVWYMAPAWAGMLLATLVACAVLVCGELGGPEGGAT